MNSYNKTILMGNLTRDPEMTVTPKGMAITKFSLALNRRFKTGDEQIEETTFVDVTAFGRQAEVIKDHMRKGRPIMLEGRLNLETWEDAKTSQNRSKLGVICERFNFVGNRDEEQKPAEPKATGKPGDDDVPF